METADKSLSFDKSLNSNSVQLESIAYYCKAD